MPCGTLAEVELVLKGLMYPANKQDLVKQAKKNDADELTLETLENVNKKSFHSHQDVVDAVTETSQQAKETVTPRTSEADKYLNPKRSLMLFNKLK